MMTWLRQNRTAIVLLVLFLAAWVVGAMADGAFYG